MDVASDDLVMAAEGFGLVYGKVRNADQFRGARVLGGEGDADAGRDRHRHRCAGQVYRLGDRIPDSLSETVEVLDGTVAFGEIIAEVRFRRR